MNALQWYADGLLLAALALCASLVLSDMLRSKVTSRDIPRQNGRPYLKRFGWGSQSQLQARLDEFRGKWRVRLHHFLGPDDAGHHNHPFKWSFSILLWGSYTEEIRKFGLSVDADDQAFDCAWFETRRVRFFNWIPQGKYHRIVALHGNVWTLFVMGPRVSSWGFWQPGRGHVPWKIYNAEHGQLMEE